MIAMKVDGRNISISHPEKVLFPDADITKRALAEYYQRVSKTMILHTKRRPANLKRYPEGINNEGFVQQQAAEYFPDYVGRISVQKKSEDGQVDHVTIDNTATLVYLAGQDCITPHVWLSRADKLTRPDRIVFDLDPPGDESAVVTLTGNVETWSEKFAAAENAWQGGAKDVENNLTVTYKYYGPYPLYHPYTAPDNTNVDMPFWKWSTLE